MKKKNSGLYDVYLKELGALLEKSKTQDNPAYWLYTNKARTPLFMLQSITRLLYKATNDPFAKKWRSFFKKLEDIIGKIDYYDVFIKQFRSNRAIKKEQIDYLIEKMEKVVDKFNRKLKQHDFYISFLEEFKAANTTDFTEKALLITLHEEVKTEILLAEEFFNKFPNGFTDFESEVHALRRKLRWISIYGISLGGIIVLKAPGKKYTWEKKFITRSQLESAYNKLPVKKGLNYHIPLNKKAFFALSYVIEQLGIIKDKGLAVEALADALKKTSGKVVPDPESYAIRQLKLKESKDKLLKEAYDLVYTFFVNYRIHIELISA